MEIVLSISLFTQDKKVVLNYIKTYESVSVPSIGAKVKDSLFAVTKEIIDVVFDYSNEKCYVILEPREETYERLDGHIQEVAAMHNWILQED